MPARYGSGRDGRSVGTGVRQANRSGRGDGRMADGSASTGGEAVAGTSEAESSVRLDQRERPGADRLLAERVVGQGIDRHVAQEVRRGDRLGAGLQEPAERRLEREVTRCGRAGRDRDLAPRGRRRTGVLGILERLGS